MILALIVIIPITTAWTQQGAQILSNELTYNFGTVVEVDGFTNHTFMMKNMGDTPSVITRVTALCGCTRPGWTRSPTTPGKTGEVKITYNPEGRPGPFYRTVLILSNGKKGSYSLAIKGNAIPKPSQSAFTYPCSIGDLRLHMRIVLFGSIRPEEMLGKRANIKSEGKTSAMIHLGKVPHYLDVQVNPATLRPDEAGATAIFMDVEVLKWKGQVSTPLPIMIQSAGGKEVSGEIQISVNITDNFSKLSATDEAQTSIVELSGALLESGKLPNKKSVASLIGGKVSGTFETMDAGKIPLMIYSVTCDDGRVSLSGGKREPKPGATATFKVTLRPKEIKTKLETLINVVRNGPNRPIRLIKMTAYK